MTDANIFELMRIVNGAGGDPADIASALWFAGYQKPARNADEAVRITAEMIRASYENNLPPNLWPDSWDDIQLSELNDVVAEAGFPAGSTAADIAKAVIKAGYKKEKNSD